MSEAWAKLRDLASVAGRGRLLLSGRVAHASLKTAVHTCVPLCKPRNAEYFIPLPDGVLDGVGRRVGVVGAGHVHLEGSLKLLKGSFITIFTDTLVIVCKGAQCIVFSYISAML